MSGDSESDVRVKLEIDESAGDLDVAREKFESALQDLLFKEEASDSEEEEQQQPQQQHAKQDPASETSINTMGNNVGLDASIAPLSRPPRKRRRKDTEITQVSGATAASQQSSFVVRIFDRSIDLAQFSADSPLYPICRAWLLNEPSTARGAAISDLGSSTPPPSSPETASELTEVHALPKPAPWGPSYASRPNPLIPTPLLPPPAVLEPEAPMGLQDWLLLGNERVIPKVSDLMSSHRQHWKNVRRSWKAASAAADARYEESAVLLKELVRI